MGNDWVMKDAEVMFVLGLDDKSEVETLLNQGKLQTYCGRVLASSVDAYIKELQAKEGRSGIDVLYADLNEALQGQFEIRLSDRAAIAMKSWQDLYRDDKASPWLPLYIGMMYALMAEFNEPVRPILSKIVAHFYTTKESQ
jgi:hypothetical protein